MTETTRLAGRGLPDELIECLNTRTDIARFRAVSKSFRSLIPPFRGLQLPCQLHFEYYPDNPYALVQNVVYHITSPTDDPGKRGRLINIEKGEWWDTRILRPTGTVSTRSVPWSFPKVFSSLEFRVFSLQCKGIVYPWNKVAISDDPGFPVVMVIGNHGRLYHGKLDANSKNSITVSSGDLYPPCKLFSRFEDAIFHEGKFYIVCRD